MLATKHSRQPSRISCGRLSTHFQPVDEREIGHPRVRRKNPIFSTVSATGVAMATFLEVLRQALYDFMQQEVNVVGTKQILFAIAQNQSYTTNGGAASVTFAKQELHTNVTGQGATLPNPQSFLCRSIQHIVRPDILLADFHAFEYQTQIDINVGDKKNPYYQGILARVPSGAGTFGFGTPAANATSITQGWPTAENFYSLQSGEVDPVSGQPDRGVAFNQGQLFQVVADPTQQVGGVFTSTAAASGGTGIKMWFFLEGVLWRSVQ